jgi:ribosomal protein L4
MGVDDRSWHQLRGLVAGIAEHQSLITGSKSSIGLVNALVIGGPEVDGNFRLAARNIPNVDVLPNAGLNVYDVLRRRTLVLTKDAVEAINARFAEKEAA